MLKTIFVARLAALTKVTRIKTALAVVHARIHPSVHPRGRCERASYLMRSPAYPLYVKPLHCSTASGISAGTALFFSPSTTLTIDRLNLGQIPPAKSLSLTHAHSQVSHVTLWRTKGSWDPPPNTPPPSKFSWSLSLPHMNIPLPFMSATHVEARVLETDRGKWNTRSLRVLQFKRHLPGCAVIFSKQRLFYSLGQQRPP